MKGSSSGKWKVALFLFLMSEVGQLAIDLAMNTTV